MAIPPNGAASGGPHQIVFEARGDAGDWAMTNTPLSECNQFAYTFSVQLDDSDGHAGLFYQPPSGTSTFSHSFSAPAILVNDAHSMTLDSGLFTDSCEGVSFFIASNASWSLSVTVTLPGGSGTISPSSVTRGNATTLSQMSATSISAAGLSSFSEPVVAGWTHLQVNSDRLSEDAYLGERIASILFPTDSLAGTSPTLESHGLHYGAVYEAKLPTGRTHGGGVQSFPVNVGHMDEPSGFLNVTLQSAEAAQDISIFVVQIPTAPEGFPAGISPTNYD